MVAVTRGQRCRGSLPKLSLQKLSRANVSTWQLERVVRDTVTRGRRCRGIVVGESLQGNCCSLGIVAGAVTGERSNRTV
jgi:hypothetical protein